MIQQFKLKQIKMDLHISCEFKQKLFFLEIKSIIHKN